MDGVEAVGLGLMGRGRSASPMPTLAAKCAARMGHPDCAGAGEWLGEVVGVEGGEFAAQGAGFADVFDEGGEDTVDVGVGGEIGFEG